MKSLSILSAMLIGSLLASACSKTRNDTGELPSPDGPTGLVPPGQTGGKSKVLDYSGFRNISFESLSWEDKCEGFARFIEDFTKTYLATNVNVSFNHTNCFYYNSGSSVVTFSPKFTIFSGTNDLTIETQIFAKFDRSTYQLLVSNLNLSIPDSEENKRIYGESIGNLKDTLTEWLEKRSGDEVHVFSQPYRTFVKNFENKYGRDTQGIAITKPKMTFQIIPDESNEGFGIVNFLSVDPTIFVTKDSVGNTISTPYLECQNIECLNAKPIGYELLGIDLILSTPMKNGTGKQLSIFRFDRFD